MSSYSTKNHKEQCLEHQWNYERERHWDRERVLNIYHNKQEYREKVEQQALARYYRLKEQNMNTSILNQLFFL